MAATIKEMTRIEFDKPMRERLRKAYKVAVKNNAETFVFEDNEYLVRYAKYLLEYLDANLK